MPLATRADLCDSCKDIDLERIFTNEEIPATGLKIKTIGKPPACIENLSCQLCQFFHQLGPEYLRKYKLHVRLFDGTKPEWLDASKESLDIPRRPFLSVVRENSRLQYDDSVKGEIRQAGVVGYTPDDDPGISGIQRVGIRVNYELIKSWLEHCSNGHLLCKHEDISTPGVQYILFIDCVQGRVVKRTLEADYKTLSYVWGPQQLSYEGDGPLNFSLGRAPLTVRDAVQVVRSLGRTYLWVDRFCINQDDTLEKATMLQYMDFIYENAFATIVALHGDNDQSGLPGVSSTPRVPQLSFRKENGRLVWSCPSISTVLRRSTWNTRGWTY